MNKIILLFIFCGSVFSQTLFQDDIVYPVRDSLEGLGGWNRSGLNSPYNVKIVAPGLSFPGYSGTGTGNTLLFTNNPDGDIVLHSFPTQTEGNVYLACMIRVDSLGTNATQGYNICFDAAGSSTNLNTQLYVQKSTSNTFKFGIRKRGSVAYTSSVYNISTTYLAVMKYSFIAGADNDSAKLFIFSSSIPSNEPVSPAAFSVTGTDNVNIGEVAVTNLYSQGTALNLSNIKIDGIRISTSWINLGLTGIEQTSATVPSGYYLGQNFPNPFNPVTNIYFSIPEAQNVRIVIMNMLGEEITELINNDLAAGTFKLSYNAENLSSGVYLYRIETAKFTDSRKMLLIK